MKIKRINTAFLLFALAGIVLTGCSNEDIVNVNPQEEGTGNVSFSIVEKDYEPADNTPKSRVAIEETKTEIQDLGDGLIAEVSLVPDTTHRVENPKTRAIATPTHYTIQAFQGGVKKGELKGTFNGSTFTPDTGQPKSISLPHGTYDFVCFNDKVTANGTQLTVNRADAGTARFDVQRILINQDPKQQVTFTTKHAGAAVNIVAWYINFAISCKTTSTQVVDNDFIRYPGQTIYKGEFVNPGEKYQGTLTTPANTVPETMIYNFSTNTYSYPAMGQISKSYEANAGGMPAAYSSPNYEYPLQEHTILKDYWLPTTDCSKLKFTFSSGEFYDRSLAGKSIMVPEAKQVEANKRYIVLIRLYLNDQYLFDDGTSGTLAKNPGKTAVGVVIDPYARLAIALHDVNEGGSDQTQWSTSVTSAESSYPNTNYSDLLTVSSTGTPPGLATSFVNTHTSPLGTKSWFISSCAIFCDMGNALGKMLENGSPIQYFTSNRYSYLIPSGGAYTPGFSYPPSSVNFPALDMTRFNAAFTNVGGTPPSGTYWTNSECKVGTEYKMATIEISGGKFHLGLKSKTETAKIRPFIEY